MTNLERLREARGGGWTMPDPTPAEIAREMIALYEAIPKPSAWKHIEYVMDHAQGVARALLDAQEECEKWKGLCADIHGSLAMRATMERYAPGLWKTFDAAMAAEKGDGCE